MYSVSERYKEEIQKPQRITRIIGRILTAAGADYTITDSNVVTGSLKITDQLGSGEFSIGGVYSRNMTVKLLGFSNVSEVSNLSNARVILRFRLVYGVGEDGKEEYEDVPLGVFSVDGSKTKRKFDTVTITATDNMQNFDRDAEPNENITLYNAVALACERCGVAFATSAEDFAGFTNGDLIVTYTTDQIQTWHDLLMWIGELTGTFARINLGGALEFVKMKAETGSDGRIIPVTEIPPDVRFTTDFSDTNIRVLKVIMRRDKTELSASSSLKITSPSTMVATMELNDNPLIADKTDEEVSGYLKNLANYLVNLRHRPFETSFNGNPALQVGDYVRLKGGAIDISQAYATGIITYSCWRYRGKHDIKCRSFTTTVRQSDTSSISLMSADDNIAVLADTPPEIMRKPKSQLEKEIDALRRKAGSGGTLSPITTYEYLSDPSVKLNGMTYTIEKNEAGLISKITDSSGGELEPMISGEITDITLHNAALLGAVLARGIGQPNYFMPVMTNIRGDFDVTRGAGSDAWVNQIDGVPMAFRGGNAAVNNSELVLNDGTYAVFDLPVSSDGSFTVYAMLKSDYDSTKNQHDVLFGSVMGNYRNGWRCVNSNGYASGAAFRSFMIDVFDGGASVLSGGSPVSTYDKQHVIALRQTNTGQGSAKLEAFIDGVKSSDYIDDGITASCNRSWGLNCSANNGSIWYKSNLTIYVKFWALGNSAHSDSDIIKNQQFLMKKLL